MIGDIAESVSAVAVVVSLLLLARQTGKLRQQTEITNLIGRYEALSAASQRYDQAITLIFAHPELRPYLLDGKPLLPDDPHRDRALLVADIMAGAIDHANRVAKRFPDPAHDLGWQRIAVAAARRPVFRELLADIPYAFPDLMAAIAADSTAVGRQAAPDQRTGGPDEREPDGNAPMNGSK